MLDWWATLAADVQAAIVAGIGALISALVAAKVSIWIAKRERKTAVDVVELRAAIDAAMSELEKRHETDLAVARAELETKLQDQREQHERELSTARESHEVRLKDLEQQLSARSELEKRLFDDYFEQRKQLVDRLRALRAAMASVSGTLDGLVGRALDLTDREMVRRTALLLQESAPILAELPAGLSEGCDKACEEVLGALTKVVLYLNDEKDHRVVDGDPSKWVAELARRVAVLRSSIQVFEEASQQEEDRDIDRVGKRIDELLSP